MTDAAAVVVAAGSGERLGAGPKAFVQLGGQPLVMHAVQAFASAGLTDIVVVVSAEHVDAARGLTAAAGLAARVCPGGATRQESVRLGLGATDAGASVVAVHDGARALVTPGLIARTLNALVEPWAAVAPGLPVVDTLKLVDGEAAGVVRTVDRRGLWAVQTPQVFARRTLEEVHRDQDPLAATDDLALVERAGGRVRLIPGERRNFKITYPEDLALAEALLRGGP